MENNLIRNNMEVKITCNDVDEELICYNTKVILIGYDVIRRPVFLNADKSLIHHGKERRLLRNSINNST